ncbi:hypothetical protein TBLA_0I02860 [Henningerozyma blattae CBS 6284]|uniref:CRAL-TRIO domain-containing protein n=1 Tax=Henningerozyma blattae (strain ATCC 34711 / CBS 6284 / DSM 70876 / NBRC 10599 / NRRL Y-10934 / UCD 77-7) TaxID=1071380 RepID=I2H990_HENB6|nr:hypothetical protein TBLA_0I02860 [Tetrapisispora blattae CBS 6284]CCH62942.1 hypothetical protein TBLA_0I02860 [Tetrapisispora blattae CBS 6284]
MLNSWGEDIDINTTINTLNGVSKSSSSTSINTSTSTNSASTAKNGDTRSSKSSTKSLANSAKLVTKPVSSTSSFFGKFTGGGGGSSNSSNNSHNSSTGTNQASGSGSGSLTTTTTNSSEDTREGNDNLTIQKINASIGSIKGEDIKWDFWKLLRFSNPDKELLKFIRARKWDPNRSSIALTRTTKWKAYDHNVNQIIMDGEYYVFKNEMTGVMQNLTLRKAVILGHDLNDRPVIVVRPKLHSTAQQTHEELEKYVLLVVEELQLFFKEKTTTATLLFDLTGFSLSNMDYTAVKFIITVFEAHYPECLATMIIHNAPWLFTPIWKVVKAWLDPVVAAKVNFSYSLKDLNKFIPTEQLPKYLGGELDYDLDRYTPPDGTYDIHLNDKEKRTILLDQWRVLIAEFIKITKEWILSENQSENKKLWLQKYDLSQKLRAKYIEMDPYLRTRSSYDIDGLLVLE